jgi:hypothetical protein
VTDRDNILSKVPVESLHLFGDEGQEEHEGELPNVFSLKTMDAGATHSKSGSESTRFKNIVKKVQLVRNVAASRPRVSSLESSEPSLVYSTTGTHHSRIPSTIPSSPPIKTDHDIVVPPIEPSKEPPELFDIVDQMKNLETFTRQNTTRRIGGMNNQQYVGLPTEQYHDENLGDNQVLDPESLIMNSSDNNGRTPSEYPRGESKRDSKRANMLIRHCCLPCFAFRNLISLQMRNIKRFFKASFFLLIPMICVAFILFYFAGNPGTFKGASYSWWCLFAIRLGITLTLARVTEFLLIDYIALETSLTVRFIGRMLTLMLIQAKGWPILCVFWGIWNFAMVHGEDRFAKHWFFWLSGTLSIFGEEENPSSGITSGRTYTVILITMIITGLVIMVKRLLVSLLLGKKKYGESPN